MSLNIPKTGLKVYENLPFRKYRQSLLGGFIFVSRATARPLLALITARNKDNRSVLNLNIKSIIPGVRNKLILKNREKSTAILVGFRVKMTPRKFSHYRIIKIKKTKKNPSTSTNS